MPSIRHWWK